MMDFKSKNNEMYLSEWYDNYLLKYVGFISKPKYTIKQRKRYTELLVRWYKNWDGKIVEQTKD